MKNKTLITFSLLGLFGASIAGAVGVTHNVHFSQSNESKQYAGKIRGHDYDRYTFSARAGQKLNVTLVGKGGLFVVVNSKSLPDMVDITESAFTFPNTGSYELRVLQPRAGAIRNEIHPYKLTINIH